MTYLLLQTFLLLLSAYFLGAFLACLAKRMVTRRAEEAAAEAARASLVPATATSADITPLAKPRTIDPVQPRIDILPRPEPKAAVATKPVDTTRFDIALTGPDPNAGMPRKMIVEIRPAILKSPTGPALPFKPAPKPVAQPAAVAPKAAVTEPAKAPTPAPVVAKPAPAPVVATSVAAKPVTPVPAVAPSPQPSAPPAAASAAAAGAGAAAATAAAAAAVAAAKAAAAAVTAPRPVQPAPAPAPQPATAAVPSAKPAATIAVPAPVAKPAAPAQAQSVTPATPAPAAPTPVTPRTGDDDLQRIRAIDADTERRLVGIGVKSFDDIARWTPADINRVNQTLGLTGRIDREQWIEQAQILAKGGETYYSRNRAAASRGATSAPTVAKPIAAAPAAAAPAATAHAVPASSVQPAAAKTVLPAPTPVAAGPAVPVAAAPQPAAPSASVVMQPAKPAAAAPQAPAPAATSAPSQPQGKSVAEMAAAAAAAIAAASASVTRGIRPIEPISPMTRANPNVSMPARLTDALKDKDAKPAAAPSAVPSKDAPRTSSAGDKSDDLKRIRGVGVLIEKRLNAKGVTSYSQIANWTTSDIDKISQDLDFKGRIERENWIEQARILSSGGHTEFSRRVDRGDVETSRDADET